MSAMKDIEIRIRNGGDDAVAAMAELWESREKILFEITDAFTKARWIPVTERLPEPQVNVLLSRTGSGPSSIMRLVQGSEQYWANDMGYTALLGNFSHWMPLPEPPEVK